MRKYEGKFLDVHQENGWEFVQRKNLTGLVGVLAITNDNNIVLVEQYREPVKKICVEIPAGLVGDVNPAESLMDGANRELFEETGYVANKLEKIGDFPLSPGITNEVMTLILATDLVKQNDGGGDEDENITVIEIPILATPKDIMKLEENGKKYVDAKVFLAVYFGFKEATKRYGEGKISLADIQPAK